MICDINVFFSPPGGWVGLIISKGLVEEYNKLLSELDKAEIEQLN